MAEKNIIAEESYEKNAQSLILLNINKGYDVSIQITLEF